VQWDAQTDVIVVGSGLAGLAAAIDMPAALFLETVGRYNRAVAGGEDADFGKPILDRAAALDSLFFFGMRTFPKVPHTMGGVLIDFRARVLDLQRRPIAGLYAACRLGSCAITDCPVFGRIAEQNAGRHPRTT
jgi:succinate dehydrogenase/fumarate reductase flavoprotein subunit